MPRRSRAVEVSDFQGLVDDALSAYSADPSYSIAMARQAQTILNKRRVWQLRLELRSAEVESRALCAADPDPFICHVQSPCGTGLCPYARRELTDLTLSAEPGRTLRPRHSYYATYSIEQAVRPLQDVRDSARLLP